MSDTEWKPLIYTCDCQGDYMRWDGKIFPDHVAQYIFDVQLQDGAIHPGCLVRTRGYSAAYADAITQNGVLVQLQHGDLLRPATADKEILKKMRDMAFNLCKAENRARRIEQLEYRKSQLTSELAEINIELAGLKKEEA